MLSSACVVPLARYHGTRTERPPTRWLIAYAVRDVPRIICPLQFEATHLRRALAAQDVGSLEITCCGPGAVGVERWAQAAALAAGSAVVLAGTAGGIDERTRVGQAYVIERVISDAGESWTPTLSPPPASEAAIITSVNSIVTNADQRRALAQRTGAHLVDLESVAFARLASAHGWRWGIVRGVSDDLATSLPQGIDSWIAPDGRTRKLAVLAALLRKPSLARDVRCLRHNSLRALDSAALIAARMLRE